MAGPSLPDDELQQFIYTWSEINRGGSKGLGFGEVSPALRTRTAWMNSWPTDRMQLMVSGVPRQDAFDGWRKTDTIAAFAVDDCNVVYRTWPDGGVDGMGRDRFVVHGLIGPRDLLDLATAGAGSEVWLTADQCPLNQLPQLAAADPAQLRPVDFGHNEEDDEHSTLLRLLSGWNPPAPLELKSLTPPELDKILSAVHVAVPTHLWPDIELTTFVGRDGLSVQLHVQARVTHADDAIARAEAAGLSLCAVHRAADASASAGRTVGWPEALREARAAAVAKPATLDQPVRVPSDGAITNHNVPRTARDAIRMAVAKAGDAPEWNFDKRLDDLGVAKALSNERAAAAFGSWVAEAPAEELRIVLARVRERRTFARVRQLLDVSTISAKALASAWQRSAAAPLAYALLGHPDVSSLGSRWAVPSGTAAARIDDVGLLAQQLITSDEALREGVVFMSGGIVSHRFWRRATISALLRAGAPPTFVLHRLLVDAGADSRALCEVVVDHPDDFGDWLSIPDEYREALSVALARPSWLARLRTHLPVGG